MDPTSGSVYGVVSTSYTSAADISGGETAYILPRQLGSGSTRGTQTVGYGNVKIDGSNDCITIADSTDTNVITLGSISSTINQSGVASSSISSNNGGFGFNFSTGNSSSVNIGTSPNGSIGFNITDSSGNTVTIGTLADGTFGFSITDSSGFVLFKLNGQTWFWYDKNYSTNVMQVGELPDRTYGWAVAATGNNVSNGYS